MKLTFLDSSGGAIMTFQVSFCFSVWSVVCTASVLVVLLCL